MGRSRTGAEKDFEKEARRGLLSQKEDGISGQGEGVLEEKGFLGVCDMGN